VSDPPVPPPRPSGAARLTVVRVTGLSPVAKLYLGIGIPLGLAFWISSLAQALMRGEILTAIVILVLGVLYVAWRALLWGPSLIWHFAFGQGGFWDWVFNLG